MVRACILTVVKNEQEYLDEWIKYHLDLGVSHIFIFEDFGSDSHKEICDKYGDKVSLNGVETILDEDTKKKVLELKLTRKSNPQTIYFKKGLSYIQKTYSYDWCFVIDNDEFITLDNVNFEDIFELYKDYDAFVLQWKIYGANGLVRKPNYDGKGLIGTYTKPSNYVGHDNLEWTTKTCYKLDNFKETYFLGTHQPSDECKWCKTDYSTDRKKIVFDKIYLRHYMTKSWDEYIAKRKRGYFMGFARTSDFFFRVNPEMFYMREDLLKEIKQEKLVVLPYKQSGAQGNEIRISLKGWRKFCQFKYHFIVIGEFNDSLREEFPWVEFISCPTIDKVEGQYTPHLDMQNKLKIISRMYSQSYDGFIWTCDDKYPIKPFDFEDISTTHYISMSFTGCEKCPTSYWRFDKWKTRKLLDIANLPHINYTTHYPYYMEFKKLNEIQKKFNLLQESYVMEDIYFNYFSHNKPILADEIRFGIWNKEIFERDFQKAVDNPKIKFMCNSVEGWSKELENELNKIISI